MPRPTVRVNPEAVAAAINRELRERRWKKVDLAREAGLSATVVGFLTNAADRAYEPDVLWKVADAFDWDAGALVNLTDPDDLPSPKDRMMDKVAEHDRQIASLITTVRRLEAMVEALLLARQGQLEGGPETGDLRGGPGGSVGN